LEANISPYSRFKYLRVTTDGAVAIVTMLDPVDDQFLALSHPMHTELRDIFPALQSDPAVGAAVLTGDGDIFFAGPGLEDTQRLLGSSLEAGAKQMLEARQICNYMLEFTKPLVSALNGAVIGMGCQLAFLCDFSLATPGIRIQDSHVRLGLPAGDGGTMMWPLLVGMAHARRLLLRSHPLSAEEALEMGLIVEVVPAENLVPAAVQLARKLNLLPRFAYSSTKLALTQWLRLSAMFSSDMSLGLELAAFSGQEFKSALSDAIRKSKPPQITISPDQ
jgi:enoyl-CoA hydratase